MVNLNQLGEAAGVGAWVSLQENRDIQLVSGKTVQTVLRRDGSI